MIRAPKWPQVIALLLLLLPAVWAQRKRDPLTPVEVDQLRDTAWEPDQRLKLYLKFARARLATLEQARSAPKTTGRGQATHDLLDDFLTIYDELDRNIDTYVDRQDDIRKPLKAIIEADTEFLAKLKAIHDSAATPPEEAKAYEFVLSNILDTLNSSSDDHRKLLSEQEEAAKRKKGRKTP